METQVNLILTGVFDRIKEAFFNPSIKYIVLEGGTSSSKTYSVLQFLDELCLARRRPLLVSVMSESFPHLRMGCIRDYKKILGAGWDDARWNSTNSVYAYRPGVELEFFSADQPGKVSGPRRDVLYCNEINNIPMEIIRDQASPRTLYKEIYDFNPTHEFWIHEMKGRKDVAWIHSTYLDARHALPKSLIEKIEARRERIWPGLGGKARGPRPLQFYPGR
jgi:phage terminase large subunit